MTQRRSTLAALVLCLLLRGSVMADEQQPGSPVPFEHVAVSFEQNATDGDAEVVFDATGGDLGLATLVVVSPDGRTIINFTADDPKLGLRHFTFESPEPENDGRVQREFPEGEYVFTGTTVTGVALQSTATLSHTLPATASFVQPEPEQDGVPTTGLEIVWRSVSNLNACIVTIEQGELALEITATLSGTATRFAVPDGFLAPGTEYTLAIGTVSRDGNSSFVETTFTTVE